VASILQGVFAGVKALSADKMGTSVFMTVNNIQIARTTSLTSPHQSEIVRTYLNVDFKFVDFQFLDLLPGLPSISQSIIDALGIQDFNIDDRF
jgi:hypothetical protein